MSGAQAQRVVVLPPGRLQLVADSSGLRRLSWVAPSAPAPGEDRGSLVLDRAEAALGAYLARPYGPRPCVPLAPVTATPFQRRVWRAMLAIPPGQARTYGEVAGWLHSSPRAVGNAAAANPWPVLVPCHRIVASGGVGGYLGEARGRGPAIKRWLLAHEGCPLAV